MAHVNHYFKNKETFERWVLAKSRRDVENIERNAKVIILVDAYGNILNKKIRPECILDVIAIVGPGNYAGNGIIAEKAVLAEVGIGPTRPYNDARPFGKWIQRRDSDFALRHPLPLSLREEVFSTVKVLAEKKLRRIKNLTWTILKKETHFSKQQRKMIDWGLSIREYPKGVRFSIKSSDQLLPEIFNFELAHNPLISFQLRKMARLIDMCLNKYRKTHYSDKEMQNMLRSPTSRIKAVADILENKKLFPHHYSFLLNCGLVKKPDLLLQIITHLNLCSSQDIENATVAIQTSVMRDPLGLQIRTIPENHKKRDFVVFEVCLPELIQKRKEEQEIESLRKTNFAEELVPF